MTNSTSTIPEEFRILMMQDLPKLTEELYGIISNYIQEKVFTQEHYGHYRTNLFNSLIVSTFINICCGFVQGQAEQGQPPEGAIEIANFFNKNCNNIGKDILQSWAAGNKKFLEGKDAKHGGKSETTATNQ